MNIADKPVDEQLKIEAHKVACYWRWRINERGANKQDAWQAILKLPEAMQPIVIEMIKQSKLAHRPTQRKRRSTDVSEIRRKLGC